MQGLIRPVMEDMYNQNPEPGEALAHPCASGALVLLETGSMDFAMLNLLGKIRRLFW